MDARTARLCGVDPARLDVPHEDVDLDSRFARAARPVLDDSTERMAGSGICLAVTDRLGRVLWSWGPDRARRRRLDELALLEGFLIDEETAGTNGLGTALEAGRVVTVRGEEHFKEAFHPFACVVAPVHDPVTGRPLGGVNITCRASQARRRTSFHSAPWPSRPPLAVASSCPTAGPGEVLARSAR